MLKKLFVISDDVMKAEELFLILSQRKNSRA